MLELDEELFDDVDRIEPLRDVVAPAIAAAQPVAKPQRREREHAAGRHGDRPGHGQAATRLVDVVEQQQNRNDARGRRQQRVLERAEPEHAHARLAIVHELLPKCVQVDGEPSAGDEDAETRRNEGNGPRVGEAWSVLDPSNLAVGEHIAEVRKQLARQAQGKPDELRPGRRAGHLAEIGGLSDQPGRAGHEDRGGDEGEHEPPTADADRV